MKSKAILILLAVLVSSFLIAQQDEIKEDNFKVYGNCDECKERIESALDIEEVKFVKWNKKSKKLRVAFSSSVTLDSLKKRIAAVGHDSEGFNAPDSVYSKLPGCCLYRENPVTH